MSIHEDGNRRFTLSGGDASYVLQVTEEGYLIHLHWGKRVPDGSLVFQPGSFMPGASFDLPAYWQPWELPTLGSGWYGRPAVDAENAEGNHAVDLRVTETRVYQGKKPLAGLPATYVEAEDEADTLEVELKDRFTGLQVTAVYTVFRDSGALARSMRLTNGGKEPLVIRGAQSASVPLAGNEYETLHLKGAWARERSVQRRPLGAGEISVSSQRGASGHEENPFLALCAPETTEHAGSVWGMSLIYSGSFLALVQSDNNDNARMCIGLNPQVFRWTLESGESFQTPEAVLVYSDRGLNGLSRIYHRLYSRRLARGYWRDRERPILINNWEATYFNFNEDKLLAIAGEAKDLGIEMLVMDDGWFGKRNIDTCSLGDWTVNREKLPHGLRGLSDRIHEMGLMFGLWVEPEMISPDSDLYRAHPDWCLHAGERPRTESRNQLILDLSRTEVQDYVIRAITEALEEGNVDYVKWDMNRNMTEYFSADQAPERQMETQHRYMLGLYRVLESVTGAFPKVLFESCSGGGGRFDGGLLYYMPQTWTSDNSDAVARLSIQYGTSTVYPVSAMGAHVSAVPNHQTGRITSMQMRGDVALSGNFGFELDLTKLTPEDRETARKLISRVKAWRHLTLQGDFSRLVSPAGGKYAAWQFVCGDEALLCAFRILSEANRPPRLFRMVGLEPEAWYRTDEGERFSGAQLMYVGISVELKGDFSSRVIHLTRER